MGPFSGEFGRKTVPQVPVKLPSEWPIGRIAEEYRGGRTLNALSALVGVSRSTLSRLLKRAGHEVRGRGVYPRAQKELTDVGE